MLILLAIDIYIFFGLKTVIDGTSLMAKRIAYIAYWSITAITFGIMLSFLIIDFKEAPRWLTNTLLGFMFVCIIPKLFIGTILLINDLYRLVVYLINLFGSKDYDASRSKFISQIALGVGGVFSASFLYGMLRGGYNYTVHQKDIISGKIPPTFNGFKVIQISDLHTGSFVSERPLEKAVEMINSLEPDLVLFTGDIVNNISTELLPFKDTLSKIKAKHGVFSVLGNHDFGDYYREWKNDAEKEENMQLLYRTQKEMGWKLLMDEHVKIEKGQDFFTLIGIRNWGRSFSKYGDLTKAYQNVDESSFQILMSHDPSHWRLEVLEKFKNIDLMLSGHTHGMQFGIEIPGFKWSPVKYVYKEWAGLYKDENSEQKLYVNRGLGFLAYPGRVGISPEITLLTLRNNS